MNLGLDLLGREKYVSASATRSEIRTPLMTDLNLKYESSNLHNYNPYIRHLKYTSNLLAKFRFKILRGHPKQFSVAKFLILPSNFICPDKTIILSDFEKLKLVCRIQNRLEFKIRTTSTATTPHQEKKWNELQFSQE